MNTSGRIVGLFLLLLPGLLADVMHGQNAGVPSAPPPPPETVPAPLDPKLPTLFVIGDSTAASNDGVAVGWALLFPAYFDPAKINVANRARSGRSSRTFLTEGWWDKVLADLKPGDFVLIQFGHNDGGAVNEEPPGSKNPLRARGSLPGLGEETREIDNIITEKHEVVHTYGWYLRKFIADTRAKGAMPIVLSPMVRNIWKDGKVERGPGEYGPWSAEIAKSEGVAFVDTTAIIADQYERMGEETVKKFFPRDHTHATRTAPGSTRPRSCPGSRRSATVRWTAFFLIRAGRWLPPHPGWPAPRIFWPGCICPSRRILNCRRFSSSATPPSATAGAMVRTTSWAGASPSSPISTLRGSMW